MTAARMRWDAYETVDGVICKPGRQEERTAFSQETADRLLRIEDVSWWFQYRMELIAQIADRFLAKEKAVFDIGGGNGYTSKALQQWGWEAVLLEPSLPECRNANMRGVQTVVCNALNAQDFPAESVPQAVLLDVLEHIEQETVMLELLHDSVQSGGAVVLTVPAYRCLWSSEDDAAGHFRRYRRDELVQHLEAAGFKVEYSTYFFSFLWLPILLLRAGAERIGFLKRADERTEEEKRRVQDKQFRHPGWLVDHVLRCCERIEQTRILSGKRMPFGSSVLAVARKL